MPECHHFIARRIATIASIGLVIALGLAMKNYAGPGRGVIANWGSSIPYEMCFMLAAFVVWPRRSLALRIAICVCLATIAIEFLQLVRTPWLQSMRSNRIGMLILGNRFNWTDLLAYPIGCAVGWCSLVALSLIGRGPSRSGSRGNDS